MLKNTTIIIQAHKVVEPTLTQALKLCDNVIIYNDGAEFEHANAKVINGGEFSGKYETCYEACLSEVETLFVCRVNGGDDIYDLQEPKGDIWLARYGSEDPDHNMQPDFYTHGGASIISGSVMKTDIAIELLNGFDVDANRRWVKFGKYCGNTILNSDWQIVQSEKQSLGFTFKMWGGKTAAYAVK